MFGKADNQTQCCWVRSKRATSVLCSTPSPPLLCVLCYRSLESDHLFKASQAPNREPPKFFVRLTSRPFREKTGTVFLLLSGTKKVSDQAEPFPRRCSGQRRRQKNSGPGPRGVRLDPRRIETLKMEVISSKPKIEEEISPLETFVLL